MPFHHKPVHVKHETFKYPESDEVDWIQVILGGVLFAMFIIVVIIVFFAFCIPGGGPEMPVPYMIGVSQKNPAYEQAWAVLCMANDTYQNLINKSWEGGVSALEISAAKQQLDAARSAMEGIPEYILSWHKPNEVHGG